MDLDAFFESEFAEHAAVVAATRQACGAPFRGLVAAATETVRGGSAADCQHLATELTIRYKKDRVAIAAIALTTDSSALTAGGNDLGFENIFARQVEALAKPGDLAIGISTSGRSENVIRGLKAAREIGAVAAGFGGQSVDAKGGPMAAIADPYLVVPSKTTARVQEMHIMLGQMLCGALEIELGLVS